MSNINYSSFRRPYNFLDRKVRDALPEHFTTDYPKFITFLEKYYDFLDSDGASSFDHNLRALFQLRDTQSIPDNFLPNLISEIAAGNTGDNFTDANFYAQRIHELHRTKGTRFSIEEFFRAFFQVNADVEFPKKDIFTLGHDSSGPLSKIGPESNKFIRNNALYQIFSILIKSPLSQSTWLELYKKFVHPAGFYIAGSVVTDVEASISPLAPLSIFDSSVGPTLVSEVIEDVVAPFTQLTALFDSDGTTFRSRLDEKVSEYQALTAQELEKFYSNVDEITTAKSFTFDDSDVRDSAGGSTPDFSLDVETMDNEQFDSSFNS
tara:strand:+ start:11272 stop:12234 length:963 start_codon:yes stop_codon:yes gene_type:complete